MSTGLLNTGPFTVPTQAWRLKLDAELGPDVSPVTPHQTQLLAKLLGGIPGVSEVTATPHCEGRYVHVDLTVDASQLADAIDRAAASLHSCALASGLGRVVLVAAGADCGSPSRRG
jgi:hypothetical protein